MCDYFIHDTLARESIRLSTELAGLFLRHRANVDQRQQVPGAELHGSQFFSCSAFPAGQFHQQRSGEADDRFSGVRTRYMWRELDFQLIARFRLPWRAELRVRSATLRSSSSLASSGSSRYDLRAVMSRKE